LVPAYTRIAYPVLMFLLFRQAIPVFGAWGEMSRGAGLDAARVEEMRRRALALPWWLTWLSLLGWFPGGVIFPLALDRLAEPLGAQFYPVLFHFIVSFWLSGLIAVTYSVILMELLVVRAMYPALFLDARRLHEKAREELKHE